MFSLTTFSMHRLFLRYRFEPTFPGDSRRKELVETPSAREGFLPARMHERLTRDFVEPDPERLDLAARAIRAPDGTLPDVLCLQEVESSDALRAFSQRHLGDHYPDPYLIEGWCRSGLDVGLLSRFPLVEVRPHMHERWRGQRLFERECLEATLELPGQERLTLWVCHFKSQLTDPGSPRTFQARQRRANELRKAQAQRVAELVAHRFGGEQDSALYAIVGDLQDAPGSKWLAPLFRSPHLVDVLARALPPAERWTWSKRGQIVQQLDHVLASPALGERLMRVHVERRGIGFREKGKRLPLEIELVGGEVERVPFGYPRFAGVARDPKKAASDHCPVRVWFDA